MSKEIEISYNNIDVDELHKTFSKLNLICRKQKTLMKRKTYGFKNDGRGRWARVRDEGNKITMTIKEVLKEDEKNIHDILEYELTVNDFETACSFLEECGMSERNYMENYREEWVDKGNEIYITIDYFPFLNPYIEIEGKSEEIVKRYSELLGFDFSKHYGGGYMGDFYKMQYNLPDNFNFPDDLTFNMENVFDNNR